jgi:hypothetical protein
MPSVGKIMEAIFGDHEDVLLVDFFHHEDTNCGM